MSSSDLATSLQANTTTSLNSSASEKSAVVCIDSKVQDLDTLLNAIKPGTKVVMLDPQSDGLA